MIVLLASQIDATVEMLQDTIGKFNHRSWKIGFGTMQHPWKLAYHIVECLDHYFSPGIDSKRPRRFSKSVWEMTDQEVPSIEDVQNYLHEVKAKIEQRVQIDDQRDLSEQYDSTREQGFNVLEQYVYAIRHTMHHHGALASLALRAGVEKIMWK